MLELIDVQVGFGGTQPGKTAVVDRQQLLDYCARMQLRAALVRVEPIELDVNVIFSNDQLFAACADTPQLIPCPTVLPNTGYDLAPEAEQIDRAIAQGAAALTIRPIADYWIIAPWLSDSLFRALIDRNLPVWISSRNCPPPQVADLARSYPDLRIIFAQVGYREQRILLPLLKSFKRVHLSIGNNYTLHGGMEQLVREAGCEQLLFGTGFPENEPMSAAMMLFDSQISAEEKEKIAAGNFRRLQEEIR